MKFSELSKILNEEAKSLKFVAGMNGEHGDGGSRALLNRLKDIQDKLVVDYDLRPSEFSKLADIDVKLDSSYILSIVQNYKNDSTLAR